VVTDRRRYLFEYSAEARRPDPKIDEVIYSLAFQYPEPPRAAPVVVKETQRPPNTDYGFCGARSLRPLSVSDDGRQVRVRFRAMSDWPAVFVQNADGSESLVNFTVERDALIVHRIAPKLILRRGKSTACLIHRRWAEVNAAESGSP
jgi:type IV secretion system protein VirB9